ncbi:MAG TPA: hypothetical protein EYP85_09880 [Armatimonadetes bacterium]|nr:hypothetical protein [Armatimonadota bacterium]
MNKQRAQELKQQLSHCAPPTRGPDQEAVALCVLAEWLDINPQISVEEVPKETLHLCWQYAAVLVAGSGEQAGEEREQEDLLTFERRFPCPPVLLLAADTDQVKTYVFESVKLPEIRGASRLLDLLNTRLSPRLWASRGLAGCLFYSDGGSLLGVVPAHLGQDFQRQLEEWYLRATGVATITVVTVPLALQGVAKLPATNAVASDSHARRLVHARACIATPFLRAVRRAQQELKRAKGEKVLRPHWEVPPLVRRCSSCEMRPAEWRCRTPEGSPAYLCRPCKRKRKQGKRKTHYVRNFRDFLQQEKLVSEYLQGSGLKPQQLPRLSPARDVEQVGQTAQGRAKGYIGFIYLDGDGLGERVLSQESPAEFRRLSEALNLATKKALFRSLAYHLSPCDHYHPFEILTVGGDDVCLIVPGDVALPLMVSISETFSQEVESAIGQATMSGGVVIAQHNQPIYYLQELATELLKSAKRARSQAAVQKPGARPEAHFDFAVFKGSSTYGEHFPEARKVLYERWRVSLPLRIPLYVPLTERPYSLSRLRCLLEYVQKFKEHSFPRTQLQALNEMLERWPGEAELYCQRQIAKAYQPGVGIRPDSPWAFYQQFVQAMGLGQTGPWYCVRRGRVKCYRTPLRDLLEIYDFVA